MLYAGNNLDKAREVFQPGGQAPAADQADDPAADARVAAVAGYFKRRLRTASFAIASVKSSGLKSRL
jgi:hypothetical protein